MKALIETLTSEQHLTDADTTVYTHVKRTDPHGNTIELEVEAFITFDGGELECRYSARIPWNQNIGEGLIVAEDSFIMLTDAEMQDILNSSEVQDFVQACAEADDTQKDIDLYFARTR